MNLPSEILVVDDDTDIRDSLLELLEFEGYSVIGAANGKEALDQLRRRLPAVVLLDLMMPVMDGFEFRREQLADPQLSGVPVVIVSAGGRCAQAAKELGAMGCVQKPLDVPTLLRVIRSACKIGASSV